jgi:hypothetical protein
MPKTLNLVQKQKLTRKAEPFNLKKGKMYRMGHDNKLHKCLTTSKAQIVLKELHEGVPRGHFAIDIIAKKILDVSYSWPTLFKDIHEFYRSYDNSVTKLVTIHQEEPFMKWGLDFIGLIKPT